MDNQSDGAEAMFDEAMLAFGAIERHVIVHNGHSSIKNPLAKVAFMKVARYTDLDHMGTDRVVYIRTDSWNGRAISWKFGPAVRHQWIPLEMQIKGIPKDAPDFGRNAGILLPLREKLTAREKERITPDMVRIATEHYRKHPEVTMILFISCIPIGEKEARTKAYEKIWHEVRRLVTSYLSIICGAAPCRRRAT